MTTHPMRPIEFLVLAALAARDLHGYGIVQAIEDKTDGRVRPKPGNLYRVLDRLQERGLLQQADRRPAADLDDERRRYYSITTSGRAAVEAEAAILETVIDDLRERTVES